MIIFFSNAQQSSLLGLLSLSRMDKVSSTSKGKNNSFTLFEFQDILFRFIGSATLIKYELTFGAITLKPEDGS